MSALSLAIILLLAKDRACVAPDVPVEYYVAVVQQESAGDPLALHDDTPPGTPYHPATLDDAERIAKRLLAQGRSVGIGLGQLTARSEGEFEAKFGLSVPEALANPCANMRAGSALLQRGLRAALSTYNCGGPDCAPGYVRQVLARVPGVGATGTGSSGADVVTPKPPKPAPVLHDSLHGGEDTPGLQNWMIAPNKQQISGPQSADPSRPFDLGSVR